MENIELRKKNITPIHKQSKWESRDESFVVGPGAEGHNVLMGGLQRKEGLDGIDDMTGVEWRIWKELRICA